MSLTRRKLEFAGTVNGVEFLMHDGARDIACRASLELLRNRFGSQDGAGDANAFSSNRDAIEDVARIKYQAGQTEPGADPEVIVTESDMASPLSQKL
jgi:hypothetical protein